MRKHRWRYILPAANGVLAVALMGAASTERRNYLAENNALAVWDHIPIAEQVRHMVNFPAYVLSSGLTSLTVRGPILEGAIYLACVAALWYAIGIWADRRTSGVQLQSGHRTSLVARVCGIIGAAIVGLVAIANLLLHPLLGSAGLIWCGFLLLTLLGRKAGERVGQAVR